MADAVANITTQALGIHQAAVHPIVAAVRLPGLAIPSHPIGFASTFLSYKRNTAAASPTVEILHRPIGFAPTFLSYKRNIAAPGPTAEILHHEIGLATKFTRLPPIKRVFSPAALIDVRFGPAVGITHSYSETRIDPITKLPTTVTLTFGGGTEIVYNISPTLADRPHLLAPPYGSNHRTASPLMRWTPVAGAVRYEVHIARDINFTERVNRFDSLLTELQRGLPFDGAFYWRVRAVSQAGAFSPFSEVWYYTTSPINPLQDAGHGPEGRARLLWQFQENA